jgi:hypothetical protein
MSQTYDDHLHEALNDIKHGQHLRFINLQYRTKEVCLEAVKYESNHSRILHDFYSVPMEHLDYVVEQMKEIKKNDPFYIEELTKAFNKRQNQEQTN